MATPPPSVDRDRADRDPADGRRRDARRRRGLLNHLIAYLVVMVVAVPVNAMTMPDQPWFLLLMVGWGAPLAVHTAWAMGLFGRRNA